MKVKLLATHFEIDLIGNGWLVKASSEYHTLGQKLYVKNLQDITDILYRLATEPTEVEVSDDDDD